MKKIISLLSVFAIICTMFTTVALAGSDELYWEETVDGTNVTLTLKLNSSKTVTTAKVYFDVSAAKAACESISAAKIDGTTFNYNATKGILAAVYANADGSDSITLGSITFTNVNSAFTIAKAAESTSTKWVITDASKVDFIPDITNNAVGYEVKIGGDDAATIDGAVAGNDMYGKKTALTKISFKAVENPVVRLYKDGVESVNSVKGYALPSNVKGNAEIIGIIRYTDAGTYKLSVFDGANEVVSATYVAE